jgi:hypothetical protein
MSTIHPGGRPYLAEIARLRASLKHIRDVVGGHKQQMDRAGPQACGSNSVGTCGLLERVIGKKPPE